MAISNENPNNVGGVGSQSYLASSTLVSVELFPNGKSITVPTFNFDLLDSIISFAIATNLGRIIMQANFNWIAS